MTDDKFAAQITPAQVFDEGITVLPPILHDADCRGAVLSFDITNHTDPSVLVSAFVEASEDGGATWEFLLGVTRVGGISLDPFTGKPLTTADAASGVYIYDFDPQGKFIGLKPRFSKPLLRTIIEVVGGKLTTAIDTAGIVNLPIQSDIPDKHFSIATVQFAAAQGGAVSSITTGAITTSSGNLCIIDTVAGTNATITETDSNSNSWTNCVAKQNLGGGNNTAFQEAYNANITGGAGHTFKNTTSGNNFPAIFVTEISGHAASPFDVEAHSNNLTGSTTRTTASTATTAQAASLVHGFGCDNIQVTFDTFSVSSPWTQGNHLDDIVVKWGGISADQVVASTGTYSFTFTTSGSANTAGGICSVWKEAAAAVAASASTLMMMGV